MKERKSHRENERKGSTRVSNWASGCAEPGEAKVNTERELERASLTRYRKSERDSGRSLVQGASGAAR